MTEGTLASADELADEVERYLNTGADGFETAAVLTMTEKEARQYYELLGGRIENVSYIDRDSSSFQKGLTVTTYYQAKGLEFDQVFVAGGSPENPFFRQFRYISATRALHELYVYEIEGGKA